MTLIFKKSSGIAEPAGGKPLAPTGTKKKQKNASPKPKSSVSKVNQKRRAKAKKAAVRRAETKRMGALSSRAEDALSLRKLAAINPKAVIRKLKNSIRRELAYLHAQESKSTRKKEQARYRSAINALHHQIADLKKYEASLIEESVGRQDASAMGAANRKLIAGIASKHTRGDVVGRTKIVEYKAPGSTLWATPRIFRK